jgi:hypothetical protein
MSGAAGAVGTAGAALLAACGAGQKAAGGGVSKEPVRVQRY